LRNGLALGLGLAVGTPHLLGQTLLRDLPLPPSPALQFAQRVLAITSGDVDGDGDLDLLVAYDSLIEIRYAQQGVFTTSVLSTEANIGPNFVAIGDIDGDGNADLLAGSFGNSFVPRVRIWWGNSTGLFANAATVDFNIPSEFFYSEAALFDCDNDGDLDLVLCSTNGNVVPGAQLFLNQGGRTLQIAQAGQFPQVAAGACTPFAVDLDGDQRRDLLLVSRAARTRLFWNNPTGFAEATAAMFPVLTASMRGCAAADFDNDGDLDLALGGDLASGVFLRRIGTRQFVVDNALALPRSCVHLEAGDIDGDGFLDLTCITREQVQIRMNRQGVVFTAGQPQGSCDYTAYVVPCDLNGDGRQDLLRVALPLVTTSPPAPRSAASLGLRPSVYEHLPAGRLPYTISSNFRGPGRNGSNHRNLMAFGIRDRHPVHFEMLQFATFEPNGVARYDYVSRVETPAVTLQEGGRFTDLDGDGFDEYLLPSSAAFVRNRQGVMDRDATPLPVVAGFWVDAVGMDVDGDGNADLVALVRNGSVARIVVFASRAQGWVDESAQLLNAPSLSGSSGWLRAADFDGDGRPDLWISTNQGQTLLRNNQGVLQFVANAVLASTPGNWAHVGDVDGDGDLDLVTDRYLFLNDGAGRFTDASQRIPQLGHGNFVRELADFDDDGDLDLLGNFGVAWNNGLGQFTLASGVMPNLSTNGMVTTWVDIDRDNDLDLVVQTTFPDRVNVLVNMVRQLEIRGPAVLGGTIDFRYTASPGDSPSPLLVWFGCSFLARQPLRLENLGWLMIETVGMIVVGGWALPASGGVVNHAELVPNSPALMGVRFHAQPIEIRHDRVRLGNRADALLGL
jgi:hypothetical protein